MNLLRPAWAALLPGLLLLTVVLGGAGCGPGDWDYGRFPGPLGPSEIAAPGGVCDTSVAPPPTGTCHDCLPALAGVAMRFTSLTITEPVVPTAPDPTALPQFLNGMWTEDVRRYVLNVLLRIDGVEPAAGDAPARLLVTAGAGWHDVPLEGLPLKPGDPLTSQPTQFYLLPGSTGTFQVELDAGCAFEPLGETALGFHPGPEDHPTICSPDNGDAIPIERLSPTGAITPDCRRIVAGRLSGCIPKAVADRICSWSPSPDLRGWYLEPNESFEPVDGDVRYCKRWCGTTEGSTTTKWTNFGGFVTIVRVPLTCDSDGDGQPDGYTIAGDFEAEIVALGPAPGQETKPPAP
jgi:hypothetical protein